MRGVAILTFKVLLSVSFGEFLDFCDEDMLYYETSNSCYWLADPEDVYNKTLEACEKKSGSLAIIGSSSELDFIKEKLVMAHTFVWVGLRYSKNDNKFYWVNGTELRKDHFSDLLEAKPKEGQNCVVIKDHLWQVSKCGKKLQGICHIPNVDLCKKDNGGCDQWCVTRGALNRTCGCDKIYTVYGTRCLGQCEISNGGCEQTCTNTGQDRKCSCRRGYDQDGVKCLRNFQTRIVGAIIAGLIFGALVICLCLLFLSWALSFDDGVSDKESMKKESLDKSSDTAENVGEVDELSDPERPSAIDNQTADFNEFGSTI